MLVPRSSASSKARLQFLNQEIWSLNRNGFDDLIGSNIAFVLNFHDVGNLIPNFSLSALILLVLMQSMVGYPNYELGFLITSA